MTSIKEYQQDTSYKKWFSQNLQESSYFFHLLTYNESEPLLKFGYKTSLKKFRDGYAKFNHYTPQESYIWVVNKSDFINTKNNLGSGLIEKEHLKAFVFDYEQSIHRGIKQKMNLEVLKNYNEVYRTPKGLEVLHFIRNLLKDFTPEAYSQFVQKRVTEIENGWVKTLLDK